MALGTSSNWSKMVKMRQKTCKLFTYLHEAHGSVRLLAEAEFAVAGTTGEERKQGLFKVFGLWGLRRRQVANVKCIDGRILVGSVVPSTTCRAVAASPYRVTSMIGKPLHLLSDRR